MTRVLFIPDSISPQSTAQSKQSQEQISEQASYFDSATLHGYDKNCHNLFYGNTCNTHADALMQSCKAPSFFSGIIWSFECGMFYSSDLVQLGVTLHVRKYQ